MPKSSKEPKQELEKTGDDLKKEENLLEDCINHESDSYKSLSPIRATWDDKESMLIGKLQDTMSAGAKSQVFNGILSSIVFERAARVMAQPPGGKAWADSKDDIGKNMLMNLLLKFYTGKANEEFPLLLKLRFLDFYSNVYGSMFGLVPWRVNTKTGYVGPELSMINIRDARPQPGRRAVDASDWFGVRSELGITWLESQSNTVWNMANVTKAIEAAKKSGGHTTSDKETRSLIERDREPSQVGDKRFPKIEAFTEYRGDRWITWTPAIADDKDGRPLILRNIKSPFPDGILPVVVKHAFPLLDSMIGLGEFERGKTLQFALNSLINLYLDGVKYSIFPPLHINLNEVTAKSIKWAPGSKWYMNKPNQDVQVMNMRSGEWLSTFTSTYGFLSSAIYNLTGATPGTQIEGQNFTEGQTPEAIKQRQFKQSARDEWDRFMMEQTISSIYERWTKLITHKLDAPQTIKVFGAEITELQKRFPNEKILSIFDSKQRGNLTIDKSRLSDNKDKPTEYSWEIEEGSTMSRSMGDEGEAAAEIIVDFVKAPQILQEIRNKGGDINFIELYKRRLIGKGVRDWDKIVIEPEDTTSTPANEITTGIPQNQNPGAVTANGAAPQVQPAPQIVPGQQPVTPQQQVPVQQPVAAAPVQQPIPGQVPVAQPVAQQPAPVPQFRDENVAAIAAKVLGGMGGIPPTQ